jgi:hypothetical protein
VLHSSDPDNLDFADLIDHDLDHLFNAGTKRNRNKHTRFKIDQSGYEAHQIGQQMSNWDPKWVTKGKSDDKLIRYTHKKAPIFKKKQMQNIHHKKDFWRQANEPKPRWDSGRH